jgi:uncharacterized membrane protein
LESNKTLGGIGAILLAIPFLSLIGIILVLVAMKGMADYYNEDSIFKNALYGFIFGIVGVVALVAIILMLIFGVASISSITTWDIIAPLASSPDLVFGLSAFLLFILAFVVLYVFGLIGAIFYKKSLDTLKEKSGESIFGTAGLILLIGAIIPGIGELLKLVAWILAAVGFFSIKVPCPETEETKAVDTTKKQFCTYCGAKIEFDSTFCKKCGKKIE